MRTFMKALPFIFLAVLIAQILALPSYRTIQQRDPEIWPYKAGIISSNVVIRKHVGDIVKGFIIAPNGQRADAFRAKETALRGPAVFQLKQFDKMMNRRKSLIWTVPLNLLFVMVGFWVSDGWQRRNPPPPKAVYKPETTPEEDYKNSMNLKLEHAKIRKNQKIGDGNGDSDPPESGG